MPSPVPRRKARTVVMPTRPNVHQIALPMTEVTEAGYWLERGAEVAGQDLVQVAEVLREQALLRVDPEEDLQRVQRLRAELAVELRHHGQRGVSRHQPRQEEVEGQRYPQREDEETEAAQRVSQGCVRLLWCSGVSARGSAGQGSCRRAPARGVWVTSAPGAAAPARCPGRRTAHGWAYGSPWVGQPLKVPVSYWYQSTASITGMIGTSLSMTCWIWFRIVCCVGRARGRLVLVEQGVGGRVAVPLVVGGGLLADRRRVRRVEPVVQLVVRARAERLLVVEGELVLAEVQVVDVSRGSTGCAG